MGLLGHILMATGWALSLGFSLSSVRDYLEYKLSTRISQVHDMTYKIVQLILIDLSFPFEVLEIVE